MAWEHRKITPKRESLILSTIAFALIVVFLVVVEISNTDDKANVGQSKNEMVSAEPVALSCFDTSTATVQVTSDENCPMGFIYLGDSTLLQITDSQSATTDLHPILLQRFEAAYIAAKREGVNLYISSGFRSLARQEVLFERAVRKYGDESEAAKWVLPAPYSHHPQGLAIDVNYPGDRPGAKWLELNGSRFGLCRVYANEWWHFEGVIAPGEACPALAPNALVDLR